MHRGWLIGLLALAWSMAAPAQETMVDILFEELRTAPTDHVANVVVEAIWDEWTYGRTPQQRQVMGYGVTQMKSGDLAGAIATFSAVIDRQPELPEPWNKRATVRLLQGERAMAIADFCEAVRREPRHFGAYVNLGAIYATTGEPARAIATYELALKHNPHMPGIRAEIARLKSTVNERDPELSTGCDQRVSAR